MSKSEAARAETLLGAEVDAALKPLTPNIVPAFAPSVWELETVDMGGGAAQTRRIDMLAMALAAAQAKMPGAIKDKANPHFKSSYADLAAVWDAWREVGPSLALSLVQVHGFYADRPGLYTKLLHGSGQWIQGWMPLRPSKDDMQGYVAATTYARRCAMAAIVGITPDDPDDDGETAVDRGKTKPAAQHPAAEKAKAAEYAKSGEHPPAQPAPGPAVPSLGELKNRALNLGLERTGAEVRFTPEGKKFSVDTPENRTALAKWLKDAYLPRVMNGLPLSEQGVPTMQGATEAQLTKLIQVLLQDLQQMTPGECPF